MQSAASGVCHTDLHAAEGDWPVKPKPPFIPGHEGISFGFGCQAREEPQFKEGDRVGVPWLCRPAAGQLLRHCLGGWETLCEEQRNTGYSGSMAASLSMSLQTPGASRRAPREPFLHRARPGDVRGCHGL